MRRIHECSNLSIDELKIEIELRKTLINQMVGSLYPSILADEIELLYQMIYNAGVRDRQQKTIADAYDNAMEII